MTSINSLNSLQVTEWSNRKDAVLQYRKALELLYIKPNEGKEESVVGKLIKTLLRQTEQFGEAIFAFFQQGLVQNGAYQFQQGRLEESDEYALVTGEYMLNAIVDQITSDLVVIERVLLPRLTARLGDRQETSAAQSLRQALRSAEDLLDKLAMAAIKLFEHYMVEHATALTYFHRTARARIMPYAPVVLIGLPHAARTSTIDLMALAHEFGHHLYWNGRVNAKKGRKNLEENPAFWTSFRESHGRFPNKMLSQNPVVDSWTEEIFADTVSCLIGGPLSAYSIQRFLLRTPAAIFCTDDGLHPSPILRPYIQFLALEKMEVSSENICNLETHWRGLLSSQLNITISEEENWHDLSFSIESTHRYADDPKSPHQVKVSDICQVVERIFELIPYESLITQWQWTPAHEWTGSIDDLVQLIEEVDAQLTLFGKTDSSAAWSSSSQSSESVNKLLQIALAPSTTHLSSEWVENEWSWQKRATALLDRLLNGIDGPDGASLSPQQADILRAQIATVHQIIKPKAPQTVRIGDSASSAESIHRTSIQHGIDERIWSRLLWFDGWTSGPGGPGHIPDHPHG